MDSEEKQKYNSNRPGVACWLVLVQLLICSCASAQGSSEVDINDGHGHYEKVSAQQKTATSHSWFPAHQTDGLAIVLVEALGTSHAFSVGDIVYCDASGTDNELTRLGIGSTGDVLTVVAGKPSWQPGASGAFVKYNPGGQSPNQIIIPGSDFPPLTVDNGNAGYTSDLFDAKRNGSLVASIAYNGNIWSAGNGEFDGGGVQLGTTGVTGDANFHQGVYNGDLQATTLSGNHAWALPDNSGTIALTSDIPLATDYLRTGPTSTLQNTVLPVGSLTVPMTLTLPTGSSAHILDGFDPSGGHAFYVTTNGSIHTQNDITAVGNASINGGTFTLGSISVASAFDVFDGSTLFDGTLNVNTLSANRTWNLPDATGTITVSGANGGLLTAGTGITITDAGGVTTIASTGGSSTDTSKVPHYPTNNQQSSIITTDTATVLLSLYKKHSWTGHYLEVFNNNVLQMYLDPITDQNALLGVTGDIEAFGDGGIFGKYGSFASGSTSVVTMGINRDTNQTSDLLDLDAFDGSKLTSFDADGNETIGEGQLTLGTGGVSNGLVGFYNVPSGSNFGVLDATTLTGSRTWTLPDKSGTVAMLSDIPAGLTPANPTATIGTSAVNGTATTYMRSDAAPAFGNLSGDIASVGMATSYNNTVPIAKGGSGQTTQQAAIDALTNASGATTGNVLTYNGTDAIFQAPTASYAVAQTITINGLSSSPGDGLVMQNTTASTSSATERSPRFRLHSEGWGTTPAASQPIDIAIESVPFKSANHPGVNFDVSYSVNNTSYVHLMSLKQDQSGSSGLAQFEANTLYLGDSITGTGQAPGVMITAPSSSGSNQPANGMTIQAPLGTGGFNSQALALKVGITPSGATSTTVNTAINALNLGVSGTVGAGTGLITATFGASGSAAGELIVVTRTIAAANAGITIPTGTNIEITPGTATGPFAITMPSGVAGQYLVIDNESGFATTGTVTVSGTPKWFYYSGTAAAWRSF